MVESVTLTPEEQRWLKPLFLKYDLEDSNIAMGERVRPLLEQSGLPAPQLSQIWQIVDVENRGFLDYDGFAKVMRLVYHAQRKLPLSPRLANIPAGMPNFSAHNPSPAPAAAPIPAQRTASASETPRLQAFGTGGSTFSANGETRIPPLRTAEKQRFGALFDKFAGADGFVDGQPARDIFLKARLPQPVLGQVWALIDVEGRGRLTKNEFVVAMHLIQSLIENKMPNLPSALPSSWQPWLGTRPVTGAALSQNLTASSLTNTGTGTGSVASPLPIARNLSGSKLNAKREASLTIDSAEREQFDRIFDSLDTSKAGILGPGEAVPVLMKSGLSEDVLAKVWDLADTQSRGLLDKRDFALAMHFVKAKLNGQELPNEVDLSKLGSQPPLRSSSSGSQSGPQLTGSAPASAAPASAPVPAAPRIPSRSATETAALTDLVSLDSAVYKPLEPVKPRRAATDIDDRRFVPTTSFGQQLLQQRQLATHAEEPPTSPPPVAEPPVATPVPARSGPSIADQQRSQAELEAQITANRTAHTQSNDELATVLQAKAELETKLRDLKTTYDAGTKQVHDTQQQIRAAQDEIQQIEREIALRTSGLDAIKTQHAQEQQTLQELGTKRQTLADQNAADRLQHEKLTAELAQFAEQKASHEQELAELENQSKEWQNHIVAANHEHEQWLAESQDHEQRLAKTKQHISQLQSQTAELRKSVDEALQAAKEAKQRADEAESAADQHEREIKAAHAALAEARAAKAAADRALTDAKARSAIPLPQSTKEINQSGHQSGTQLDTQLGTQLSTQPVNGVESETVNDAHPATESLSVEQARSLSMGSAAAALPTELQSAGGGYDPVFASSVDPAVFRLPMQRPHSVSSSVVNNPPQSVRGDLGSEPSEQPTPDFPSAAETEQPGSPLDLDSDNSFEFVDARNAGALEDSSDDDEGPANAIPTSYSRSTDLGGYSPTAGEQRSTESRPTSKSGAGVPEHPPSTTANASSTTSSPPPMPGSLPADLESEASRIVQGSTNSIDELYAPSQGSSMVNIDNQPTSDLTAKSGPSSNDHDLAPPNLPGAVSGLKLQPSFTYPPGPAETNTAFPDDFDEFDDLEEAKEDETDDNQPFEPQDNAGSVNAGPDEWQQLFMKMPTQSTEPKAAEPSAVPESFELTELVNMGFSPEEAHEALQKYQHNLSEATNYLLDNIR